MALIAKIGLIGDVHCEHRRLETALEYLKELELDLCVCTGDVADGLGDVNLCCELLERNDVLTVKGNHDQWILESTMRDLKDATRADDLTATSKQFLKDLPLTLRLETPCGIALLCHGLGENTMEMVRADDLGYAVEANWGLQKLIRDPEIQFVINGHTHHRFVRHFNHLTVVNGGTLLSQRDPCFAVLDFDSNSVDYFQYETVTNILKGESFKLEPDYRRI